jgi:hypothetical protein
MESQTSIVESLFQKVETYGKTTLELTKLKALNTTTVVATSLISRLIVFLMIALFVVVLSIGVALLLGDMLGKPYLGFFIVAAFYFVSGIVLHVYLQQWLKKPISEFVISQFLQ